jgi:hypothetical protein
MTPHRVGKKSWQFTAQGILHGQFHQRHISGFDECFVVSEAGHSDGHAPVKTLFRLDILHR